MLVPRSISRASIITLATICGVPVVVLIALLIFIYTRRRRGRSFINLSSREQSPSRATTNYRRRLVRNRRPIPRSTTRVQQIPAHVTIGWPQGWKGSNVQRGGGGASTPQLGLFPSRGNQDQDGFEDVELQDLAPRSSPRQVENNQTSFLRSATPPQPDHSAPPIANLAWMRARLEALSHDTPTASQHGFDRAIRTPNLSQYPPSHLLPYADLDPRLDSTPRPNHSQFLPSRALPQADLDPRRLPPPSRGPEQSYSRLTRPQPTFQPPPETAVLRQGAQRYGPHLHTPSPPNRPQNVRYSSSSYPASSIYTDDIPSDLRSPSPRLHYRPNSTATSIYPHESTSNQVSRGPSNASDPEKWKDLERDADSEGWRDSQYPHSSSTSTEATEPGVPVNEYFLRREAERPDRGFDRRFLNLRGSAGRREGEEIRVQGEEVIRVPEAAYERVGRF
jgi:hypothetical protein